jgi:hypothetical protein
MSHENPPALGNRRPFRREASVTPVEKDPKREARYRKFAATWGSISPARRGLASPRAELQGRALQRAAAVSPDARARLLEVYREAGAEEGKRMAASLPPGGDPAALLEAAALLAGAEAEVVEAGPRRWAFRVRGLPHADLLAGLEGEVFVAATTAYLEGFLGFLVPGFRPAFDVSVRGELTVRLERP